ncbi:Nitrobenzene nitroreductase [Sinobacterium norvegicum]|uniref:Nitrobenzene nitroreductase n=1 Tax=Sinobacterium norvegicum TaxID=1641715 RepID=A0ABM9AHJ3_9GAMM|nr:nitroreductase [Sinobacterium norvegicum]CAH0992477.1 Nitrobenzene nitroreductase [Sinobacterium norvegicum]
MSAITVSQALQHRQSARDFQQRPVDKSVIKEIIELAGLSASGSNIQPWHLYVLTGDALEQALASVGEQIMSGGGDTAEFPPYPAKLEADYLDNRNQCANKMYQALDISREDKGKRIEQVMKNFNFFGAPVGVFITMDRCMGDAQCLDIGILMQSLMLLAEERGLSTCPQVSWTAWPNMVRRALDINRDEKLMAGIALGYATEHPVNQLQQSRDAIEKIASLRGF